MENNIIRLSTSLYFLFSLGTWDKQLFCFILAHIQFILVSKIIFFLILVLMHKRPIIFVDQLYGSLLHKSKHEYLV